MSFDYALLRALAEYASPSPWRTDEHPYMDGQSVYNADGATIAQHLSGFNAELVVLAPDMARELPRLHDGIENIRDYCAGVARSARAAGMHTLANEMYATAKALTDLLDGGTE